MTRGRLIVIEGLDGSGKATQTALLADCLEKADMPVTRITFPDYESRSSELVRMYLNGEIGTLGEVNVYAASSFYAADRYVSYVKKWRGLYESGHTIVADRYTTSNAAHQMSKLPKPEWDAYLEWLADFEYTKMRLPTPDLVLYLDMEPEASRVLIEKRYGGDETKKDVHERDIVYLLKCRESALYAADKLGWKIIRCCDGKEPLPVEAVAEKIKIELEKDGRI